MCLKAFHVLPTGEVRINQFMTFLLVLVSLTQFVWKDDEDVVEKVHDNKSYDTVCAVQSF